MSIWGEFVNRYIYWTAMRWNASIRSKLLAIEGKAAHQKTDDAHEDTKTHTVNPLVAARGMIIREPNEAGLLRCDRNVFRSGGESYYEFELTALLLAICYGSGQLEPNTT